MYSSVTYLSPNNHIELSNDCVTEARKIKKNMRAFRVEKE